MFHSLFFPAHLEPHNSLLFILKIIPRGFPSVIKSKSFAQTNNRMISPALILMNETDKINSGCSPYFTNLFKCVFCLDIMGTLNLLDKKESVADGSPIKEAAKNLGIPFSCENGICGSCMINVLEGVENLSEPNEAEKAYGVTGKTRLACQCKLKSGDVKIESGY